MFHRVKSEAPADQDKNQLFSNLPSSREESAPKMKPANHEVAAKPAVESVKRPTESVVAESVQPEPTVSARPSYMASKAAEAPKAQQAQPTYKSQSYLQISNTKEDKKPMADQNTMSLSEKETSARDTSASIYSRGPSSAAPAAPSYNPSVYTSPYAAKPSAPTTAAEAVSNDRKLTIGRGITMSGEIESCDHLFVEGTVEAALKGAKVLDIAETGVFYGTVEINEATISGRFEGELVVNGRLTVESTGVITGTISYGEIQVESGAIIDGRMTPAAAGKASSKPAQREVARDTGRALFEDRDAYEAAE